jgi:glycosyltransferase involved in cell wall biosynthesis
MTIEFLISTINRCDLSFLNEMFKNIKTRDFKVLVINQCIDIAVPKHELKHNTLSVRCISISGKGISKSRNTALKNSEGDTIVIGDDDVTYLSNSIEVIRDCFNKRSTDIGIFQIKTPDGRAYKKYKANPFKLSHQLDIMRVSSIEIVARRNSILKNRCFFNENLGLGADYSSGEEVLFLNDCFKKKLVITYMPIPYVMHPFESSGKIIEADKVIADGISFARLFPWLFIFVDIYFSCKRYYRYKGKITFLNYLKLLLKGNYLALKRAV